MSDRQRASDYPACERCYATLCVDSGDIEPGEITACLEIQPSRVEPRGERASSFSGRRHSFNGWFLSSKDRVDSEDLRAHLDWLFDQLTPRKAEIETLRRRGCSLTVACYWLSRAGNGGPVLSVPQIKNLADLDLEIWLDIYFLGGPEPEQESGS